jgi:hypothetical protein
MVESAALAHADPAPPPRFLRGWLCASVVFFLSMLTGLCWFARGYDEIFKQMEMHQLPLPTEAILGLGRIVRTTAGLLGVVVVAAGLVTLTIRGAFDKILVKLIVINCIGISLLIPFGYLSLHMPIAQIQQKLDGK